MLSRQGWLRVFASLAVACTLPWIPTRSSAQGVTLPEEYGKQIDRTRSIGALGPDLFGESISHYTGQGEFRAVDLSLPGNNALPVELARRYVVRPSEGVGHFGQVGSWELDLPHLAGVFARRPGGNGFGWQVSTATPDVRCSVGSALAARPPDAFGPQSGTFTAAEFWQGNRLHVPGAGDQSMLVLDPALLRKPADGAAYRWITEGQWFFSCLPQTANNVPGEGFLARAPDGTRYWFDWFVKFDAPTLTKPYSAPIGFSAMTVAGDSFLPREENRIYPTRIEDRYGNSVTYTYDPVYPERLKQITSSDGRTLTLTYGAAGLSQVGDGSRTVTYDYTDGMRVTLPDGSAWHYDFSGLAGAAVQHVSYPSSDPPPFHCE